MQDMDIVPKEAANRDGNRDNLLVLIEKAQEEQGHLSDEVIKEIARALDVSLGEAYGVATFYSFFSRKPLGRNVIRVCQSLPCYLKNYEMIIESIAGQLGVNPGETTADNRFSLELTNCIGACDQAPAMLINDDLHGDLTPEKIAQILKEYQ